ncbi:MAG: 2-polyprenylphenol 6-hydroxylase [Rhodospirillaceae bacterium]|nr:2-polyprenylphenol 6-hydroxylase [Rhodospirillaceae bacterium]MDE0619442.1 2-polyprenylphenol 6-hydroxylase [Rhodospirillaceae bacterium]
MFRSVRNVSRLIAIAYTLARHDALFPLEQLHIAPFALWIGRRFRKREIAGRPGERLALALQRLGPSFIKLGQMLSTRPDLLGEQVAGDLAALQDRLPPFDGALARRMIEEEFGRPVGELFRQFDNRAVAAASIAQVHFAVTADGREVAVKVLRPDIEAAFARDLDLLYWVAGLVHRLRPDLRRLKPVEVVKTFADSTRVEMDLRMEAAAARELAENFDDDPTFRTPDVDWERTGRRVLTLERIQGIPVDQRDRLIEAGHDPTGILGNAAAVFFNQVFRDGFFHADQHPGNAFVDAEGRIVAVDFGIMGRLDRETRYYLADMLMGFLSRDYRAVADVHFRAGYIPPNQSRAAFALALRAIAEPIFDRPLHDISIARLLGLLFQVTERFEIETQPQLLLLQKTMLVTEGVGRTLNPDINMWTLARPLIEAWMREHRGPQARIAEQLRAVAEAAERLPATMRNLDRALERLGRPDETDPPAPPARQWPYWAAIALLAAAALALLF